MRKNKVELLHYTTYKNSNWIINVRVKTIKLLEENIGINLCDLGLGNNFLDMTKYKITTTTAKMDNCNFIKFFYA